MYIQVLSSSIAKGLTLVINKIDSNKIHYMECINKLQWLTDVFLPYLDEWEESVDGRKGFSPSQKNMMMLSKETRDGLKLTGMTNKNVCM